jgi:cycloeucalenol cycloisomerase
MWFSPNPDKAWVEKFFLLYTPVWMALMAMMMLTGWVDTWSNRALLLHACLVALPIFFIPLLVHRKYSTKPVLDSYFLKANIYLFVFGFWGNYAGSEYFFDLLGMVYNFPNATTTLDSALIGSDQQAVPVIMYGYTHAYFMTYHATANIALRRLKPLWSNVQPVRQWLAFLLLVLVIGYCWAWAETRAMANPLLAGSFYYENMTLMLKYGSMIYATYFIASFPIYYFIDEDRARPWSLLQVVAGALAASTLTFYMLDMAVHIVGRL